MAVQRVAPSGTTSPVESGYRPALRREQAPVPRNATTLVEQIEQLDSDYRRAMFCRHQAETFRRRWFTGRERELAYVMARAQAGDPRFRHMTRAQLEMIARWRWSGSSQGQYLSNMEKRLTEWAHVYLSFAEVEALHHRGMPRR